MDAVVSYLTRKRSGDVAHRDVEVNNDVIALGRGADSQVYLPDPRVRFNHAEIHSRASGLIIEAGSATVDLVVNGVTTQSSQLGIGDRIGIGPYEVVLVDPPEGKDLAITVELVRGIGDDLEKLKERSCTSIAEAGLRMRATSWVLGILVLGLFLAWPVAYYFAKVGGDAMKMTPMEVARSAGGVWPAVADLAWDSGEISGPHRFIASSCGSCHTDAFVQVQDDACIACHTRVEHHADPVEFKLAELTESRCQTCHKEHNGSAPIILEDDVLCADCHSRLKESAPSTALLDASDFGDDHPQFRPTLVTDAEAGTWQRHALDPDNWPVERSNLKFTHKKHLKPEGLRVPGRSTNTVLQCGDCHQPEPGGVGMAPITMEAHCAECHELKFEPASPKRVVPHGDTSTVALTLKEFYGDMALRGGAEMEDAPASVRRRAGTKLTKAARLEALEWADQRAERAADYVFGKSVCRVCHEVSRTDQEGAAGWHVEKVVLADRWMPKGLFDHGQHEPLNCVECHKAQESELASDVLLPGIETCQNCHGGAAATARVPTTCTACHDFHQPFLGPMRPEIVKSAGG